MPENTVSPVEIANQMQGLVGCYPDLGQISAGLVVGWMWDW